MTATPHKKTALALAIGVALTLGIAACGGGGDSEPVPETGNAWMRASIVARQAAAGTDAEKEAVAKERATLLLAAMTLDQKMQQLTGAMPEVLPELPECYGARHVSGIAALNIPTFRITNGPVGLGQNDCVAASVYAEVQAGTKSFTAAYTHPSSAKATALPSAIGAAASFDPAVATAYGEVIGDEMNHLALHVFEAPGLNMARLPVLGRNFEYFGEDPYLTGVMGVAEVKAVQAKGLIGMPKHYLANEQETNRQKIQTNVDPQVLREIYMLPFEMTVKDGKAASVMCAYNYVNGVHSCENEELLTKVLRDDWGFTGYVQSDFFSIKSTAGTLRAGMDHEMPIPQFWSKTNLTKALADNSITVAMIDKALERRYTQTFKWGIFDRALKQTPIDFAAHGQRARSIGTDAAVLLQNNGALPIASTVRKLVVIGKASQVYARQAVAGGAMVGQPMGAGGGSSDVVPTYTVAPVDGIKAALTSLGNTGATVQLVLVDDANATATIDGAAVSFADALAAAGGADAVVLMAGTISEEGADRATTADGSSLASAVIPLAPAAKAGDGGSLDWYAPASLTSPATATGPNGVKNSNTVALIKAVMGAASTTGKTMVRKTALVLKDNAGVAMDPALVGAAGPAILEVWFPGQEDGNIVADLLFGKKNPSGKLPVTFPLAGRGFLDSVTAEQFPGVVSADGKTQTVTYAEKLNMGYRWYDANASGQCAVVNGTNPCVAFPFGHGLSYSSFATAGASVTANANRNGYEVKARVTNTSTVAGGEVVQVYLSLPASASAVGAPQPPKRLVGFQKVQLAPGASQEVTVALDPNASNHPLSVWNQATRAWVVPAGQYTVYIGKSSAPKDLVQAGTFTR
ncbi:beta-glucosidase [Pseudorhodoferax sp. Leaf267]|uniref:beta-glucosidase family protein n=1 Tax=Pseudorhodoferax sp. Leaf267 TaxID=1736316 RepID=UPI0007022730|nr:glycoside hydrolase family 3 N-terminal domain-containing protein [Pseudorhodoferax sp. Leaf267]KQP13677.1 beta-glucosidase [Pseudorhodoferax sp. Leaf267]